MKNVAKNHLFGQLFAKLGQLIQRLTASLHSYQPVLINPHEIAAALQNFGRILLGNLEQPFLVDFAAQVPLLAPLVPLVQLVLVPVPRTVAVTVTTAPVPVARL